MTDVALFAVPALDTDPFAEWWSLYPRKVARKAAETAYRKAAKEVGHERLYTGLLASRPALQAQHQRGFCPHPTTWLNQGRWDDVPEDVAPSMSSNGFLSIAIQGHVASVRGIAQ